jgi:glycosyltransferase EpsF
VCEAHPQTLFSYKYLLKSMNDLKVLHLIHGLNQGGIETWLISMIREISRDACAMDICCKGPDVGILSDIAEKLGARVFHCPLGFNHPKFARQLTEILSTQKYTILHNHVEIYSGFPVWIAQRLSIPTITMFHNTQLPAQARLTQLPILRQLRSLYGNVSIQYALKHSEFITASSQAILDSLPINKAQLEGRSRVWYGGVTIADLKGANDKIAFRQSLGWEGNTPIVLHVGRFAEQKNHVGLLKIFEKVRQQIPTAKLLMVGVGSLKPQIEAIASNCGLMDSVQFLGGRDDVPLIMSLCDVFLFPSLYEGFGLVAIEASAAGLPVVGSKNSGLVEAVSDGVTGLLHDVLDIEGMAKSVIHLLKDPNYAQSLALAGRNRVIQNFSISASANKLLEMYQEVINKTATSRVKP